MQDAAAADHEDDADEDGRRDQPVGHRSRLAARDGTAVVAVADSRVAVVVVAAVPSAGYEVFEGGPGVLREVSDGVCSICCKVADPVFFFEFLFFYCFFFLSQASLAL